MRDLVRRPAPAVTLAWVEIPALTLAATSAMAAQVATLAMAAPASGDEDSRGHSLPSTDCSE
jgi:hypothetical protein